ncbi:MAG: acyltransferase, partial [Herminiimonas sp.]|nr:acyltransferase [Herminiimonas sp.]
ALFHLYDLKLVPTGSHWLTVIRNGYIFVDLFFVLSGYVIFSAYHNRIRNRADIESFVLRRFGRLFPLLIFATVVYVLLDNLLIAAHRAFLAAGLPPLLLSPPLAFDIPGFFEILGTVTLTHGLGLFDRLILNYASWSISTEFHVYLLFLVVVVTIPAKVRTLVVAMLCTTALAANCWLSIYVRHCLEKFGCGGATYDFGFIRCIAFFTLGMLVYKLPKPNPRFVAPAQWLVLLLAGLFFWAAESYPKAMFLDALLFPFLIYAISTDQGFLGKLFGTGFFQMLGQRSYSLYLLHPVLLLALPVLMREVHGIVANAVLLLAYVPVLIVMAGWTFRHIEDPMRNHFNAIASKRLHRTARLKNVATDRPGR